MMVNGPGGAEEATNIRHQAPVDPSARRIQTEVGFVMDEGMTIVD